jgi:glycosyltransferase involved in cell wall biosynthesis
VKYLRNYGWEPVLYIPSNPEYPETDPSLFNDIPHGLTILSHPVWEPYNLYKWLIGRKKEDKINAAFLAEKKQRRFLEKTSVWIRGNWFIPDARKFWIRPSVRFLSKYLAENPVSLIISTGPPHSMHLIAQKLKEHLSIPWLADFRDPWTSIDFYRDLMLTERSDRKHHRLELNVLKSSDAVTVISDTMAADFRYKFNRNYEVITNGYDEDDLRHLPPALPDPRFSISHIGTLVSSRNPVGLWKGLKNLLERYPEMAEDLEIKLVGKIDFSVNESLECSGLNRFVTRMGYLTHDRVVEVQRNSQVLLLLINDTPNAKMILTGKFFEYLSARRPILCLGPADGDAAKILRETTSGYLAEHDDIQRIEGILSDLYRQYKKGVLGVNSFGIERYSRRELTRVMVSVMERATQR